MRILTWNILFEIRDAAPLRAAERHPAIFDAIARIEPDIAALQELTPASLAALRARGGVVLPAAPADVDPYGVGLWCKDAPTSWRSWRLPGGKPALLACFETPWGPLSVLVLHLSSDRHPGAQARREDEARAALAELPGGAAVVLGDLNCGAEDRPAALAASGLREVWPELHPEDEGFTWNPGENVLAEATSHGGAPRRLDAIYWRPGAQALRPARVERAQGLAAPGLPLSDHDGVVADFVRGGYPIAQSR